MKQLSLGIASIILVGFLGHQLGPWWIIAPVAAVVALLLDRSPAVCFGMGFAAAALLWGSYASWLDWSNAGLLSQQIGVLFRGLSGPQLLAITTTLGGLVGGLGALTGSLGRQLMRS
ncbi:MAG: hypothetical protein AAF146_12415 [Bacteroidota bacterium]